MTHRDVDRAGLVDGHQLDGSQPAAPVFFLGVRHVVAQVGVDAVYQGVAQGQFLRGSVLLDGIVVRVFLEILPGVLAADLDLVAAVLLKHRPVPVTVVPVFDSANDGVAVHPGLVDVDVRVGLD